MNEAFREWLRQNRTREQMQLALDYHYNNVLVFEDFAFSCEEEVMGWVAEQCKAVLQEGEEENE